MNKTGLYYAHSRETADYSSWQLLADHLHSVGEMAGAFGAVFGCRELATVLGRLHDLGKYSQRFDARLHGGKRVDHSSAGAKIAMERWARDPHQQKFAKMLAFAIAGHHAGLANGSDEGRGRATLKDRLALEFGSDIPQLDEVWRREIDLPEALAFPKQMKNQQDVQGFSFAFLIRMLYSCLVDADYLDTRNFYQARENLPSAPSLNELQHTFTGYLRQLAAVSGEQAAAPINRLRNRIQQEAKNKADLAPGLFTLFVPTGGGKTLTSMAFALDHACCHDMRRIIYVIPYTSIIEQNAQVFRNAFAALGDAAVLEHHSAFDDSSLKDTATRDKLHHAAENWDMPVVVTTAVQFFESLFADRASKCRKLHNIAGSVIILDEAQMIPSALLRPILAAINELALNYRCSVVLCTATQPAIKETDDFYHGLRNVRELADNPEELFQQLHRTTIRAVGTKTDADLQALLAENQQMLLILNNRRHVRALYDEVRSLEGVYALTTLMCAAHRRKVLDQVRTRLHQGKPCRLIATSLVECGVDVSFPFLMREQAGLDSIAQAAGRCNREGKYDATASEVWVFGAEGWRSPPALDALAGATRAVLRKHADALSPEAMRAYFHEVYRHKGEELDKHRILETHRQAASTLDFAFQNIAHAFRMIDSGTIALLIAYDHFAEKQIEALRFAETIGARRMRALQPYLVQIPLKALNVLNDAGRIEFIQETRFGTQFPALIGLDLYDACAGFSWEQPDFLASDSLIC